MHSSVPDSRLSVSRVSVLYVLWRHAETESDHLSSEGPTKGRDGLAGIVCYRCVPCWGDFQLIYGWNVFLLFLNITILSWPSRIVNSGAGIDSNLQGRSSTRLRELACVVLYFPSEDLAIGKDNSLRMLHWFYMVSLSTSVLTHLSAKEYYIRITLSIPMFYLHHLV